MYHHVRLLNRLMALVPVAALLAAHTWAPAQSVPPLVDYTFSAGSSKTLPGGSSDSSPNYGCNGVLSPNDQIQNLALMIVPKSSGCFSDGRYNHRDYLVEAGTVSGGGNNFAAYRIHEPFEKASEFLYSTHVIYYRFPTVEDYTVYSWSGSEFRKIVEVPAASIIPSAFIRITNDNPIDVSGTIGHATYVFVPSSTRVSTYTLIAPGVEAARIKTTPMGDILKYRFQIPGAPYDTLSGYPAGPGEWRNRYSDTRRFFLVRNGDAGMGAVWQDQADSTIQLTWFGSDRMSPSTVSLPNPQGEGLAAATGDGNGNVFYVTVERGSGIPTTPRTATLTAVGPDGSQVASTNLDTSTGGLNIVGFHNQPWGASLEFLDDRLALIIGRHMSASSDGLNHQGAIAAVFDANTLALQRNWGQTSGHSWESVLTRNRDGEFIGIDLGDNYPRGIHLHKFTSATKRSRVVSTFKTRHGTTPQSPAGTTYPQYPAISGAGITYYQWSNDNDTYNELGGIAQTDLGYAVSFAGERSPAGLLLDNSRVGGYLIDPRNIGFVTVREDFENASGSGAQVSDDLVVTSGVVETGGFYNFGGGWSPQRNAGVVWLTNYSSLQENATRLKMLEQGEDRLLLLWEIWTPTSYVATRGMTISADGTIIHEETDIGSHVRLHRRDDPYRDGDAIYLVSGNHIDSALELVVIEPTSIEMPVPQLSIARLGTDVELTWPSETGSNYQLQTLNPTVSNWTDTESIVPGDGNTKSILKPVTHPYELFRLLVTP